MSCGSGGCASGGCGIRTAVGGSAAPGSGGGCGSDGCSNGACGADTWDGTYREVAGVKIGNHAKTWYCDSTAFDLLKGDAVVVESEHGEAFAVVVQPTGRSRKFAGVKELRRVLRRATAQDVESDARNRALREEALLWARERVKDLRLEMKLVETEPSFDGRRLLCYFTADERVDFRELVRDAGQRFKRRVEMRQIGARDEAKLLGGYGICGRPLCCSTFLTEFAPISVKMAKRQGLSLNPSKISGLCGRLMCCLRYEDYDAKKEAAPQAVRGDREPAAPGAPDPARTPPQPPTPEAPPGSGPGGIPVV